MSKNSNNPLLKGLSGMLGDTFVFREFNGETIIANKPKRSGSNTEDQQRVRIKFRAGVGYAKACKANAKAAAYYEARLTRKFRSIYAIVTSITKMGQNAKFINTILKNFGKNQMYTSRRQEIQQSKNVMTLLKYKI